MFLLNAYSEFEPLFYNRTPLSLRKLDFEPVCRQAGPARHLGILCLLKLVRKTNYFD